MGMGGKGSSESNQQTTNDNYFYDQRVAVAEGGIGVGSGSGNIVNDASIITRAGDAIAKIGSESLKSGENNVKNSLLFASDNVTESFAFGRDSLGVVERTLTQANDVLARVSEGYAANLKDNSGVAPSTIVAEYGKFALVIGGGLGLIYLLSKSKAA